MVCASIHARECITTNYIMHFIELYAKAYAANEAVGEFDARQTLNRASFHIVPMVNPDGVEIVQRGFEASKLTDELRAMRRRDCAEPAHRSWKANSRGVDINRNFDYGWGRKVECSVPASSGYPGPAPLSEPETRALAAYAESVGPDAVVALHTQGEALYMSTPDTRAAKIAEKIACGTGFAVEAAEEPYGSFQDFVDHHFGVFYACVELCPYVGPWPFDEGEFWSVWRSAESVLPIVASGLTEEGDE